MNDDLLLDATLIADPHAGHELGPSDAQAITDTELAGARIQLVRTALAPLDIDGAPGLAAAIAAIFHAPPGARFSHGTIRCRLIEPEGAAFVDVAPETAADPTPIAFKVAQGGKLGLELGKGPTLGGEASLSKEFTVYRCAVKSSGAATRRAIWTLSENPDSREGIGHSTRLAFTLRGASAVSADVLVSARLIKPGIAGGLAAIRDMILGPALQDGPTHRISLAAPPRESGLRGWFGLLGGNDG